VTYFYLKEKKVLDLLKKTKKIGCKLISTPMDSKRKLNSEEGQPLENIYQYPRLVEN
jgi:hypothetical protein